MRKLILSVTLGVLTLAAQTTNYPGSLDTNATLFVTADNVQSTLALAMAPSDNVAFVASGTGFAASQIATVCDTLNSSGVCTAWEHMLITAVNGQALTVTRGIAGTSAQSHVAGKAVAVLIDAAHQTALRSAVIAIETALGANLANIPGSSSGAAVPIAKGGTGATTQSGALSAILNSAPLPVANGGTGVSAAQGTGSKVQLSSGTTTTNDCVKYDNSGNTADSGAPCNALPSSTGQLQYLRTQPNTGNNTTYQFAASAIVNAVDYNYPAQTPGGSLSSGVAATVTFTPCPLGVAGTDQRLRFWLSGGTGTAESVASTGGGTCTSGASTGTVTFTPANSHSGAWTIQSSLSGFYEAIAANPGAEIHIPAGAYTMRDCMSLNPAKPLLLAGDGASTTGTFLNFGTVTSGCSAISMIDTGITNNEPKIFRNFAMQGTGTSTGGSGVYLEHVVRVTFDHVQINSFAADGLTTVNAFEITVTNGSTFFYNGHWGWNMSGVCNLNRGEHSYLGTNSRSNGFGSVSVSGNSSIDPSEQITFDGVDFSNSGSVPFTSVTVSYGLFVQYVTGLTVVNGYNEGNLTDAALYQGATTNITEYNNWINSAPIVYAADVTNVRSFGNTFYGTSAVRTINNTSLATYEIGWDNCLSSSGECTSHPHLVGTATALSLTGAFTAAKAANYIATESGANNAIAGALTDQSGGNVPLAAGLQVKIKLSHTLQAGANTFALNGGSAKNIKSHLNVANNIAAAYASGSVVTLLYDGTQWQDCAQ